MMMDEVDEVNPGKSGREFLQIYVPQEWVVD